MPLLASIFTSNSKTKADVVSKLKAAPALRQTKPINAIPSVLLLLWEAHATLEQTLKIVPVEQRWLLELDIVLHTLTLNLIT
jgi:hypothetical protein